MTTHMEPKLNTDERAELEAHRIWEASRQDQIAELLARAEQAERQVRAGLSLADEWDSQLVREFGVKGYTDKHARELRAALSGVSGPTDPLSETTRRRSEASAKAWERRRATRPTTEGASDE